MLLVLVLGFFVNVQATPNSRVARYLEVDGFKDCLIDMVKPGGQANVEYCFPLSQPAGCPNNVWQEIGEAYKGKSRKKRSPQTAPGAPPPVGAPPPGAPPGNQCTATSNGRTSNCIFPFKYKSRTYYQCTTTDQVEAWCATRVKGDGITVANSGDSIKECNPGCPGYVPPCTAKNGEKCQFPFTETVNGVTNTYNSCTRDGGDGRPWCRTRSGDDYCNSGCPGTGSLPTSRPTQRTTQRPGYTDVRLVDGGKPEVKYNNRWRPICGHFFWDNNNGADLFCQQLNQGYLSGTINKGNVAEYFLGSDALQIGKCRSGDRWLNCNGGCNSLQVGGQCTDGLINGKCGAGGVAGIKITCSRNERQEKRTKTVHIAPSSQIAYVLRNRKWVPICGHYFWNNNIGARLFCQKMGGTDGSIISGNYEVALPEDGLQVGECESGDSWLQCTGGCNSLNIGGQCDQYAGYCQKGKNAGVKIQCTGVPRTKRSLPPAYINEIGHDQCLEKHSPPGANHTEYCLPATKPDDCSELSWDEIQFSFDGEVCPSNDPSIIGEISGPPAYLSIRGHQKCLKKHYSAGEFHAALCLPESRPNKCRKQAYEKLIKQIFL